MKGRPRDPTRTRRQTGHRRKPDEAPLLRSVPALPDPAAARIEAPVPDVLQPQPPAGLPEEARTIWLDLLAAIGPGRMSGMDVVTFEALVKQIQRMRQAGALVDDYGVLARDVAGNVKVSPFVKAERDAAAMVLRYGEQFGLTVASRVRLGLMQLQGQSLLQSLNADLSRTDEPPKRARARRKTT